MKISDYQLILQHLGFSGPPYYNMKLIIWPQIRIPYKMYEQLIQCLSQISLCICWFISFLLCSTVIDCQSFILIAQYIIRIMNSYNSYFETINPIAENNHQNKKYSLRRKYQNPIRQQPSYNTTLIYNNLPLQQQNTHNITQKQEQLLNNKPTDEGFNFNCIESAQRILDFNQVTSLNIKNNHTKTLSTTPSFENPFMYSHMNSKQPRKSKDDSYNHNIMTKNSLASSKEDLQPTKTKSQKTSVSHKYTHNTNERLYTENNSQPPSLAINSQDIDRRNKISLKNTWKFNNQSKSQFLICLKYSDLKQPISSIYKNRLPSFNDLLDYPQKATDYGNPFTKYICSTLKGGNQGCQCQPKCFWIDRWTNLISDQQAKNSQSLTNQQTWQATIKQIQKDLPRTQPQHKTFKNPQYISCLREVLVGYAKLDCQVGYVQGMNFIGAALVYHSRTSYQALKVMQYIMKTSGFRKILLKDLAMSHLVTKRCMYELKRLAFDLYSHIVNEEVQIQIFITSWYFSMFGNFIPIESMHLVIDKFIRKQFTGLNQIIIALLIYLKNSLLNLRENNLMMAFSNQQITLTATTIDWNDLIARSNNLLLQPLLY